MTLRAMVAALTLVAVVLAGCGAKPAPAEDVIVLSGATATVTPGPGASAGASAEPTFDTKGKGHIAGVVVNDAIVPIEGATAHLTSLDLVDITDRYGKFEFVDLPAGRYLIRFNKTDHESTEAVLEVEAGKFTRAKVILDRILPPEPYLEVVKFEGFAGLTNLEYLRWYSSSRFPVSVEAAGLHSMILEASMDPYSGGRNGFELSLRSSACCATYWVASLPNPFWGQVSSGSLRGDTHLNLDVTTWSSPVPEQNKDFEVFVSMFYNGPPPPRYSAFDP